jgi:hypothetical protein
MTVSDFKDLSLLSHCDLVRFEKKGSDLTLIVVADNSEDELEKPVKEDDELGDEQPEYTKEIEADADEGMNGHLFKIVFAGVKNLTQQGAESDNYQTTGVKLGDHHLVYRATGLNMASPDVPFSLSFDYAAYEVFDRGKIQGPDV